MKHGRIVDIQEGNQYWSEIEDSENFPKNDWTEYQAWFKYYFNKLYKIVTRLAEPPNFR
jgi:formylmethanofuran dehydrogenase subunit A